MAYKLTYFPLLAKGIAPAFALEFSGVDWSGGPPESWKELKPTTPWGHLPVLQGEDVGVVGHEIAILNTVALLNPTVLGGCSPTEVAVSQQLLHQAEDLYTKLSVVQPTIYSKDKAPGPCEDFWSSSEKSTHNRNFGLPCYLGYLEQFITSNPIAAAAGPGKFTVSGHSIGECKLAAVLHIICLIKEDVLNAYPMLKQFYEEFLADPRARGIVEGTGKFKGGFKQYFIALKHE